MCAAGNICIFFIELTIHVLSSSSHDPITCAAVQQLSNHLPRRQILRFRIRIHDSIRLLPLPLTEAPPSKHLLLSLLPTLLYSYLRTTWTTLRALAREQVPQLLRCRVAQ